MKIYIILSSLLLMGCGGLGILKSEPLLQSKTYKVTYYLVITPAGKAIVNGKIGIAGLTYCNQPSDIERG